MQAKNGTRDEPLRIGELAASVGLNPKTIRYYEDIGLLPPPARTRAGYRQYDAADRDRLTFVLKARSIGLTLDEIGDVLALSRQGQRPCGHVVALLDEKIAGIDRQLRSLKDVRQELVDVRRVAKDAMPDDWRVCGIIEHLAGERRERLAVRASSTRGVLQDPGEQVSRPAAKRQDRAGKRFGAA